MRDIRLEEIPFEFDGKTYQLRCNMNVLADVQAAYGGTISGALSGENPTQSVLEFLAAMLNDYADEMGWPERWTAKQIGRKLPMHAVKTLDIMGLVARSITPPASDAAPVSGPDTTEEPPAESGN
jgi:hypothetical protein